MTNKERAKIYRKAAEMIPYFPFGCCYVIYCLNNYTPVVERDFPEVFLFENMKTTSSYWWPLKDRDPRILALLFAEQIALNP